MYCGIYSTKQKALKYWRRKSWTNLSQLCWNSTEKTSLNKTLVKPLIYSPFRIWSSDDLFSREIDRGDSTTGPSFLHDKNRNLSVLDKYPAGKQYPYTVRHSIRVAISFALAERLFSFAGMIHSPKRGCLSDRLLDQLG